MHGYPYLTRWSTLDNALCDFRGGSIPSHGDLVTFCPFRFASRKELIEPVKWMINTDTEDQCLKYLLKVILAVQDSG